MLPTDVQIVSVDDHVIEHATVWQDRLPAKYLEAGPRSVRDDQGRDVWMFEGRPYLTVGLNAVVGKKPEDYDTDAAGYHDMLPGCYDIKARLADMDIDGITAQLCFPNFPGFAGSTFFAATDKDLATACVSAWNDFILDEWCASAPGRQIPLSLVPYWDIDATVAEVKRVVEKGSRAISFIEMPHAVGLPSFHSEHWDPMYAVMQEAGIPLCLHFGSGGAPSVAPGCPSTALIAMYGLNSVQTTVELLNSRIFERFPGLNIAMSEGGIGWMPYVMERCDYVWERHQYHSGMNTATRPSEIFRQHIYGCFISDNAGLANLDLIGADNVMFETDYPHSDSNWPHSRKKLEDSLANVPDDQARKIAELNARKLFNFPRLAV
jgi:predicted TIM-barrel fold metal-dependent hydrolase